MTIILAISSVFCVMACHWLGLLVIRPVFQGLLGRLGPHGRWGQDVSLAVAILLLVTWLFLDVALCAALVRYHAGGGSFPEAFLFAIASFTTVGADTSDKGALWSLAGPLIAMCGIFIFGWTTSFLVECSHAIRDVGNANKARAAGTKN